MLGKLLRFPALWLVLAAHGRFATTQFRSSVSSDLNAVVCISLSLCVCVCVCVCIAPVVAFGVRVALIFQYIV